MALKKTPRPTVLPDPTLHDGIVAPRIPDAMRIASEQLTKVGIRHALVGGLVVGAYGHPRVTKDVDFLLGEQAFAHQGRGLVTIAPGVLPTVHPASRVRQRALREIAKAAPDNFHGTGDPYARP